MTVLRVVAGVIVRDGLIFAAKRKEDGAAGLKWEFPGGKIETDETPEEALYRELIEELDVEVIVGRIIGSFSTPVGKHIIQLECYWCSATSSDVRLNSHVASGWFKPADLASLDWAKPDIPVVDVVIKNLVAKPQKS